MLVRCPDNDKLWTTKIKRILFDCDLEYVWIEQRVNNRHEFLKLLRNKLTQKFYDIWESRLSNSSRYSFYNLFKEQCEVEQYLYVLDRKVFRDVYIRFRMGITELYSHKLRYFPEGIERVCPLCREGIETEVHFLFVCPALYDLRERFLFPYLDCNHENLVKFLIGSKETSTIRALSIYLYRAFKWRQDAIASVEQDSFFLD